MRLRTSCFNSTIYKKNLTRFAPAWGLYTLCLILGLLLIYANGGTAKRFHFAANMTDLIQIMGAINLIYGALVAQLLFDDLYNSRMCYALHAMPVRRESLFWTNVSSGLTFSVVPSLVMVIVSLPLLVGSCFDKAMLIPLYVFAGINLQFICFFGMAVFCCLCVGNRVTMVVIYGLLNFGAMIAYWLINTVYTPMLYGVVTPSALAENLTPVSRFLNYPCMETDQLYELKKLFNNDVNQITGATYRLTDNWNGLFIWAAVGIAFLILAMVLYKKRNLECAGDAMAFKLLEPVFQVLGAVVTAAAAQFFVSELLGFRGQYHYMFLIAGLVIGWFACRMMVERSTRVFRLRNWYGLGILAAALALSLVATKFDILGVEDWMPNVDDVKSVTISHDCELTDKEDIQKILNLQAEALDTRLEESGAYIQGETGNWVHFKGLNTSDDFDEWDNYDSRYAFYNNITYTLNNGKTITRRYAVWADGQAGDDAREIFSRWDIVNRNNNTIYVNGKETHFSVLDYVLNNFEGLYVEGIDSVVKDIDRTTMEELIAAMRADSEAGNLAQIRYLHKGHFRKENSEKEGSFYYRPSMQVNLNGKEYGWYLDIFPECENTINWLKEHDLFTFDIMENSLCFY